MSTSHTDIERKRDRLLEILTSYGRVAVAFSAGVDSTVVAKAAQLACGDKSVAVTAVGITAAHVVKPASELTSTGKTVDNSGRIASTGGIDQREGRRLDRIVHVLAAGEGGHGGAAPLGQGLAHGGVPEGAAGHGGHLHGRAFRDDSPHGDFQTPVGCIGVREQRQAQSSVGQCIECFQHQQKSI